MLVVPERQTLVISTDAYAQVAAAIPHSRSFTHDGKQLVAVHHGPDEALVLKNIGLKVPEPIRSYYQWPGRFPPMDHQKDTAAFLTMNRRGLCLNSPGTGKTISALWAADYLLEAGAIKRVLIIAPLSTLSVVWGRELYHHLPHRSFDIVVGSRQKRIDLLSKGAQYCIINHDGFTNMAAVLTDFDLVIYDEATALKTPSSQRFRVFNKWVTATAPWLWMLTGTPISQNPTDAWSLARLVGSTNVPRSYTAFREMVMRKVTTFKWVPRPDALETCKNVLQPSIRFSLNECKDLPETNYVGRMCTLTKTQAKAFKDMEDHSIVMFQNKDVTAANAAVALSKLLQICCGVLYGNDSERIVIDSGPRYDALTELLQEIGDKAIVFCPLRGVQDWLEKKLAADGYDVASVHGDVSKTERNRIFGDFQNTENIRVLLAHPKVAAHGLTLTRAKDIIWFAPIYSLEQYEQANARIRRLTTSGKTNVWHIYATKFEAELYRRLRAKQAVLSDFLNLVRGINEEQ
jgi:SNF2 family DNA or RNA helicase